MAVAPITSPYDSALHDLCRELRDRANQLDQSDQWAVEQLALCGQYGVYQWFVDARYGGRQWSEEEVIRGYLALASACLTTTFILTQRTGACHRIASGDNLALGEDLLPKLARGEIFATVGISHLTTSRRHLARPVLRATAVDGGYVLDGFSPWVTGARHADYVVVGAEVMEDDTPTGRQLLATVPTQLQGVAAPRHAKLTGLTSSHTGPLNLSEVFLEERWILNGPVENVMTQGAGGSTGGLQTSTLALGLARAAVTFIESEAQRRPDLDPPHEALERDSARLEELLMATVRGQPGCSKEQLRTQANSLALRSAQAALAAAKGAGYVDGHPAGRWCREALFFLVWSCPQPVVTANMCELAGIAE